MDKHYESDSDSIVSLESEIDHKREIKEKTSKPKGTKGEPEIKKKRVMTEKQKENLAKARVLARKKRSELKSLKDREKALKKDDLLIKTLELEKKVKEHQNRIKNLAIDAGYESESKRPPKPKQKRKEYVKKTIDDDDAYEVDKKSQIAQLEERLNKLRAPIKQKEKVESESESDSSSDESEIEEKVPVKKAPKKVAKIIEEEEDNRYKPKKPSMVKEPLVPSEKSRKKPPNLLIRETIDDNAEIQKALKSLFG